MACIVLVVEGKYQEFHFILDIEKNCVMKKGLRKLPREQISINIPKEWNENMKHGRCWCGKDHNEFDKGQKFYCSEVHAKEYSKRIKYWSNFKDEVLAEHGEICVACGKTDAVWKKEQEKLEHEAFLKVAKEHHKAINEARSILLSELQEQFDKIMDDAYVFDNFPWRLREMHRDLPDSRDVFDKQWFVLEVDHKIPVGAGGEMWNKENLQVLCNFCHKKKTKLDLKKIKEYKKTHED